MTILKRRLSRWWHIGGVVVCLVLVSLPVAATAQRPRPPANHATAWQADIIMSNGKITTLSPGHDPRTGFVDSIAIRGGEVVAMGSAEYVRHLKGPGTKTVDLKGRRVLPGLIDGHIHGNRNGYHCFTQTVRLDLITSRTAALAAYAAKDAQLADEKWVWTTSGGWNVNQLDTPGMFSLAELDAALPGNPVWVQGSGFSGTQVNSRALAVLGLTAGSPGVEVDPVTGLPTGRLTAPANGQANAAVLAQLNAQSIEEIADCLADFVRTSNSLGLTAWNDADGNTAPWGGPGEVSQGLHGHQAILHLHRNGRLNARVALHTAGNYAGLATALSDTRNAMGFMGDDMLRYMGSAEDNDVFTDDDYRTFVEYAAANRLSVEHHVGNHNRNLDGYELANAVYPIADLRWTIAHPANDTPTDVQLARAGALGIGYTLTFSSVRNGGTGPRFRSTMNSDARMCLASDAMNVAPWAPFQNLWYVVSGNTLLPGVQGVPAAERLTREEALRHATVECAWNLDQDGKLGTLEVGNHADLIVLSDDYFETAVDNIKDIKSLLTVVDGRVVYATGEYASLED